MLLKRLQEQRILYLLVLYGPFGPLRCFSISHLQYSEHMDANKSFYKVNFTDLIKSEI